MRTSAHLVASRVSLAEGETETETETDRDRERDRERERGIEEFGGQSQAQLKMTRQHKAKPSSRRQGSTLSKSRRDCAVRSPLSCGARQSRRFEYKNNTKISESPQGSGDNKSRQKLDTPRRSCKGAGRGVPSWKEFRFGGFWGRSNAKYLQPHLRFAELDLDRLDNAVAGAAGALPDLPSESWDIGHTAWK